MISVAQRLLRRMDIRRRRYGRVFAGDDGQRVLADLRRFCMGEGTPFSRDPYETAMRCGRQEVFQRIIKFVHLSDDEIEKLKEQIDG